MFDSIEEQVSTSRLGKLGNPLKPLGQIEWSRFGSIIHKAFDRDRVSSKGGAERYLDELMFKILVLQGYHGVGDEQMDYLITERTSYRRFLGLASDGKVPEDWKKPEAKAKLRQKGEGDLARPRRTCVRRGGNADGRQRHASHRSGA